MDDDTPTPANPPLPDPLAAFRLDGRCALVTGASSGLGVRFAEVLAAAGASLVLAARRAERLEALAARLPDALAVPCDLSRPGAPEALVDAAEERYGAVDVLVNNAGISNPVAALDYPPEEFRREVEIDLVAPYTLAREVARRAVAAGRTASIVNLGSVLGTVGGGRLRVPGYAAAKGGLHNLTRELASEWARKGVRVNVLAPGWFESEMSADMFTDERALAYITDNAPMGRPGRPGELDGALLFLASDASSFVTGQILHVDGGWTAI
ncbi:MAG: SDR family oxidoreductase [Actinomyces sp.]|nr:MAG: SDR family oxidoreductase [Actinomyces sp.]